MTAALKGIAHQRSGMLINVIAYYGVGLPLAAYLAFARHMGVVGLLLGLAAGVTAQFALQAGLLFGMVDWEKEAKAAAARWADGGEGAPRVPVEATAMPAAEPNISLLAEST